MSTSSIRSASRGSIPGGSIRDQLHPPTIGSIRSGTFTPSHISDIREEQTSVVVTPVAQSLQSGNQIIDSRSACGQITPVSATQEGRHPQAIQIAPNRLHASSNYHYYPEMLEAYGITEADWHLFTTQFVNANLPTSLQMILLSGTSIAVQILFAFILGPVGFPAAAVASATLFGFPGFFGMKGHCLRRNVRNRNIPNWLSVWNIQYFNPKGLMIGFNLPGRKVNHAAVAPRVRVHTSIVGKYKRPKSNRKVTKRPRLVVVKLHDPVPEAGRIPQLDPIKLAGFWRFLRHEKSPFMMSHKYMSRIEAKRQKIEQLREQRYNIAINGLDGASSREPRPEKKWLQAWKEQAAFKSSAGSTTSRPSWTEMFHLSKSKRTISAASLDGTASGPAVGRERKRKINAQRRKRSRSTMLGGSRMRDASRNML